MGIPGQSNLDPTSFFRYHAIVRMAYDFNGDDETEYRYFDPSYGVEYAEWAYQCSYLYSESEYDFFAIEDFVSMSLAGLAWATRSAVVDESIAGIDFDGDGIGSPDTIDWVLLMREGDASDIKLQ